MAPGEVVCRGEAQSQNGGIFFSFHGPGMKMKGRFLRSTKNITYNMFFLLFTLRITSNNKNTKLFFVSVSFIMHIFFVFLQRMENITKS